MGIHDRSTVVSSGSRGARGAPRRRCLALDSKDGRNQLHLSSCLGIIKHNFLFTIFILCTKRTTVFINWWINCMYTYLLHNTLKRNKNRTCNKLYIHVVHTYTYICRILTTTKVPSCTSLLVNWDRVLEPQGSNSFMMSINVIDSNSGRGPNLFRVGLKRSIAPTEKRRFFQMTRLQWRLQRIPCGHIRGETHVRLLFMVTSLRRRDKRYQPWNFRPQEQYYNTRSSFLFFNCSFPFSSRSHFIQAFSLRQSLSLIGQTEDPQG